MRSTKRADKSPAAGNGHAHEQKTKVGFQYEFGGPIGVTAIIMSLPCVVIFLYRVCPPVTCNHDGTQANDAAKCVDSCLRGVNLLQLREMDFFSKLPDLLDWKACLLFVGWFSGLVLLERVVPCRVALGAPLPDGSGRRLPYRINGFRSLLVVVAALAAATAIDGGATLAALAHHLHDRFEQLAAAAILWSSLLAVALYAASFRRPAPRGRSAAAPEGPLLAAGGNSGSRVYDFWMGRELNPRTGSFDWKVFCELRPGLMGWLLLNLGMAAKEWSFKGHLSPSMLILNLFQGLYVVDALYFEEAILTTMDVTTDGFGFMLAFGDLAWVPFTYSLPARYLATRDPWPPGHDWILLPVATLGLLGFYAFRAANAQKDAFRRDPTGAESRGLESMETRRGTRLLVSGWWGMARKINYSADWLFGLSWSLCAGFSSLVPYFYPIYFAILLFHRAMRDDHQCSLKYGADWAEYKRRVPRLFVPGVF